MKSHILGIFAFCLMLCLSTAHAGLIATGDGDVELHINDSNDQLLGAKFIDVFGTGVLYDVFFVEGAFADLSPFNGPNTDFDANTAEEAANFSQALLDYVFIDYDIGYDFSPSLTFGCNNDEECLALTPYSLSALTGEVLYGAARNLHGSLEDQITGGGLLFSEDTSNYEDRVWANWQVSGTRHELPTDVPEPSSVALLFLGLIGMRYRTLKRSK